MRSSLQLIIVGSVVSCSHSFHLPPPSLLYKKNGPMPITSKKFVTLKKQYAVTTLYMSPETMTASSTVLISSIVGFASDKLNVSQDSGLGITLILAATLSNLGFFGYDVPISHPIYDLCWSRFLPASLALILFTTSSSGCNDSESQTTSTGIDGRSLSTKEQIVAVGVPFLIGSVGSFLGCIISASLQVWSGSIWYLKNISMTPIDASVVAGCLAASYIGGTVNFFATARILSKQLEVKGMNTLLSAMAAADLIVMAIYFGSLTKLMSWSKLHRWFPPRDVGTDILLMQTYNQGTSFVEEDIKNCEKKVSKVPSAVAMMMLAWVIVETSSTMETYTSSFVPGMQCAFVALFGTTLNQIINRYSLQQSNNSRVARCISQFKRDVSELAPPISEYCFYLLFAAIGATANLRKALTYGLPCIVFASMSLFVHILTIFHGSFIVTKFGSLLNKSKSFSRIFPLATEEVCCASSAAIGGASTAAALAGKTKTTARSGLVLAATLWGIVGYAISTTIGVWISISLHSKLV